MWFDQIHQCDFTVEFVSLRCPLWQVTPGCWDELISFKDLFAISILYPIILSWDILLLLFLLLCTILLFLLFLSFHKTISYFLNDVDVSFFFCNYNLTPKDMTQLFSRSPAGSNGLYSGGSSSVDARRCRCRANRMQSYLPWGDDFSIDLPSEYVKICG